MKRKFFIFIFFAFLFIFLLYFFSPFVFFSTSYSHNFKEQLISQMSTSDLDSELKEYIEQKKSFEVKEWEKIGYTKHHYAEPSLFTTVVSVNLHPGFYPDEDFVEKIRKSKNVLHVYLKKPSPSNLEGFYPRGYYIHVFGHYEKFVIHEHY